MREETAFAGQPVDSTAPGTENRHLQRLPILDGWRACSILLVLAGHLLPLGPHRLQINVATASMGMALFFTLSGFLITQFMMAGMPVAEFMARRLARILPLGWAAVAILLLWHHRDPATAARNLLFVANLPPASLLQGGEHLWSLCVEMQFYICIAAVCLLFGRRGLYIIPALALCTTLARIWSAQPISIVTWHRVDEILAGGIVALTYSGWLGARASALLDRLPVWPLVIGLAVCSSPYSGPLEYMRPYAASFLVGASLAKCPARLRRALVSRPLAYIAEISYALYVIHGMLASTWLGTGGKSTRYIKRPLLLGVTFVSAHLSTRYFEQPITRRVRNLLLERRERANVGCLTTSHARSRAGG